MGFLASKYGFQGEITRKSHRQPLEPLNRVVANNNVDASNLKTALMKNSRQGSRGGARIFLCPILLLPTPNLIKVMLSPRRTKPANNKGGDEGLATKGSNLNFGDFVSKLRNQPGLPPVKLRPVVEL